MFHIALIYFLSVAVWGSFGALELGNCDDVEPVEDFDEEKFLGMWYLYETNELKKLLQSCVSNNYTKSTSGDLLLAEHANLPWGSTTVQTILKREGETSRYTERGRHTGPHSYWIIGTDYQNYAVVYSCTEFFFLSYRPVYILTRTRTPSYEIVTDAEHVLIKNNIDVPLCKITQNNCNN